MRRACGRRHLGVPQELADHRQALAGGLGSAICEFCVTESLRGPSRLLAIPDQFIQQGGHEELIRELGLDGESIALQLMSVLVKTA